MSLCGPVCTPKLLQKEENQTGSDEIKADEDHSHLFKREDGERRKQNGCKRRGSVELTLAGLINTGDPGLTNTLKRCEVLSFEGRRDYSVDKRSKRDQEKQSLRNNEETRNITRLGGLGHRGRPSDASSIKQSGTLIAKPASLQYVNAW